MGKLVSNWFISLDGVVESPDQWHFPYFDDRMGAIIGSGMETCAAFLMGREMYDQWSQYWPGNEDDGFGPFINSIPKHVVSTSLTAPEWNNTSVLAPDPDAVRALKTEVEGDLMMSGSIRTVRWLLAERLVDELALLVHPIVVGHGEKLFVESESLPLRLVHQEALDTGVVHLRYAPA